MKVRLPRRAIRLLRRYKRAPDACWTGPGRTAGTLYTRYTNIDISAPRRAPSGDLLPMCGE